MGCFPFVDSVCGYFYQWVVFLGDNRWLDRGFSSSQPICVSFLLTWGHLHGKLLIAVFLDFCSSVGWIIVFPFFPVYIKSLLVHCGGHVGFLPSSPWLIYSAHEIYSFLCSCDGEFFSLFFFTMLDYLGEVCLGMPLLFCQLLKIALLALAILIGSYLFSVLEIYHSWLLWI